MKVIWGARAKRDLRELVLYIAQDSLQAAESVNERILKSAEVLSSFPRGGRIGRVHRTRERVVSNTPYILVYRISKSSISILRVYHSARKWPKSF